ncbi:XRE family transcriptional regulator [Mycetocola tolaasinivorans]|uniref:XRE family transcriptional regulator n=1 Tax=Mycetocola tolaasinivorans TaxID=76635 RepID=A0A3L7AAF0_9MICO|nr:helix-turn-helix transcriptional regulator [Mycetocola tolaasinivorans]RLP76780.1 XRE family transcriptional regulator [Mycetocola tolaasinivorans]
MDNTATPPPAETPGDTSGEGGPGELGRFLRSRRDRLTPEDVGVRSYGRRRVSGLRREELAPLAGVSVTYYTRLEQGQSQNASDSVIEALARALQLRPDERAHLFALARPGMVKRPAIAQPEIPNPGACQLLHAMETVPALLLGHSNDVLAWNRAGHRLLAGHLPFDAPATATHRPNHLRMLFLDRHSRALYRNWQAEAEVAVGSLRYIAAQFPDDQRLHELIHDLNLHSTEFSRLWTEHTVQFCTSGTKMLRHPEVGDLDVDYEILHLPEGEGQRILTHSTAPGTPAHTTLRRLLSGPLPG